jgi:predicted SnoaL-like aldol condensation-catalyzing enzyme
MDNIIEWLSQDCPEEDRRYINGVPYIPIEICEKKLDQLTKNTWGTKSLRRDIYFTPDGRIIWSGSLELTIEYFEIQNLITSYTKRTLIGTATFNTTDYVPNTHWDSIGRSLCIANAASDLGNQFGRNFYAPTQDTLTVSVPQKRTPDKVVRKQYDNYIKDGEFIKASYLVDVYDLPPVNIPMGNSKTDTDAGNK